MNRLPVLRHPDAVSYDAAGGTLKASDYEWDGQSTPTVALWTVTVALAKAFGGVDFPARDSGGAAGQLVLDTIFALKSCGLTLDRISWIVAQNAADPWAVAHALWADAMIQCKDSLSGPEPKKPYPWGWILGGTALAGAGVATVWYLSRRKRRRRAA